MKFLYIVDYWVPFPSSEYGGVINVIAESDSEVFNLLSNEKGFDNQYQDRIMPNIIKAQKFSLLDEYESGIIEAFTTWIRITELKNYTQPVGYWLMNVKDFQE